MNTADFQAEVLKELRAFEAAYGKAEVNDFVEVISRASDPEAIDPKKNIWIGGAAARSSGGKVQKRQVPAFVKDAHRLIHEPTVKQRICAAMTSHTA